MSKKALYGVNYIRRTDGTKEHKLVFLYEVEQNEVEKIKCNLNKILKFHKLIYKAQNIFASIEEIYEVLEYEREVNLKMPKLINGFLGEVRSYQDRTGHFLNENFPAAVQVFKEAKSYEYDTQFCYRYLDQLRNYLQHCDDLPYSSIKSYYDNGRPVIKLYMKNEVFIKQYPAMKAKLKDELMQDLDKNIDIIEQINLMRESILRIHDKIVNVSIDDDLYKAMLWIYSYKEIYPEYEDIIMTNRILEKPKFIEGLDTFNLGFVGMMLKNINVKISYGT